MDINNIKKEIVRTYAEKIYGRFTELTEATAKVVDIMEQIKKETEPQVSQTEYGKSNEKEFQKFWEGAHRNSLGFMSLVSAALFGALGEDWKEFLIQKKEEDNTHTYVPFLDISSNEGE